MQIVAFLVTNLRLYSKRGDTVIPWFKVKAIWHTTPTRDSELLTGCDRT